MTTEDAARLLALILLTLGMGVGQLLLCLLLSELQKQDFPAPLWRFMERCWDRIYAAADRIETALKGRK